MISDKLKALLHIAARVQQSGSLVRPIDVERARQQGASDVEIHDTVLIAAAFCMFNRYVDGLGAGASSDPTSLPERARLVAEHGYSISLPQPPDPGSVTPPPSFAWDDWYTLVGGRSIRIEEVDDILRQIYNDQYAAIRR